METFGRAKCGVGRPAHSGGVLFLAFRLRHTECAYYFDVTHRSPTF